MKSSLYSAAIFSAVIMSSCSFVRTGASAGGPGKNVSKTEFTDPPASATPGVYWYFMDGNFSHEGVTRDLESMKAAGIGRVVFLEVNVGVPKGPVKFLSDEWLEQFKFVVAESKRLGIEITLGVGPGWAGSGGPWVKPEDSMSHLVASETTVTVGQGGPLRLAVPEPRKPYFGEGVLTPDLKKKWQDYYEDVAVLAYPVNGDGATIADADEKALYYREPYTSKAGVKPYLPAPVKYDGGTTAGAIARNEIIDLTGKMNPDGTLMWRPDQGTYNVMRFGRRNNGAITRPAPEPGLGFESDKMNTDALAKHLAAFTGKIFDKIGGVDPSTSGGIKMLHIDSWEMGAQNWTANMREEFGRRRGYNPLKYYPVFLGKVVDSAEISERFLWDLRLTAQELVLENHAGALKKYAHEHGLGLSIEPYDMNPTADLTLGAVADISMGEFWSKGYGFNSAFSCIEATSIGHVGGHPIVQAEAFTGDPGENWNQYPGSMKNQGDWAFALGINRFFYHTFAHQPLDESLSPGMTMGPYGMHWDRKQTWWPMVGAYHKYISRCQYVLQQGRSVSDILYLTPEGAPQVFVPPPSALAGDAVLPDKRGYGFDGCDPGQLMKATVRDGNIEFPSGAQYRVLVLPMVETMTPGLLAKVLELVKAGATVVGEPVQKSPSLEGFPECDGQVKEMAAELWVEPARSPNGEYKAGRSEHGLGAGKILWRGEFAAKDGGSLYPSYYALSGLLDRMKLSEDFATTAPLRYQHRTTDDQDIYFVSNSTTATVEADCVFRAAQGTPEIWDPMTGAVREISRFHQGETGTSVPLAFGPTGSCFVVFEKGLAPGNAKSSTAGNDNGSGTAAGTLAQTHPVIKLEGQWEVTFDPKWGGPGDIQFDKLTDWASRPEEGIKYYSGTAIYRKNFDAPAGQPAGKIRRLWLDLGEVHAMARVRLNGVDLGVVWTDPWRVDITDHVKPTGNQLEIEVANLWPNRMIGDKKFQDDGVKGGQWPDWMKNHTPRPSKRFTFTTYDPFKADTPLLKSGLIGPVTVQMEGKR